MDIRFTLGAVLFGQRRFEEALEQFLLFIDVNRRGRLKPKPTQLIVDTFDFEHKCWGCISDCHYELGQFEDAVDAANKAIALRPHLSVYKITLARSFIHQGRIAEARAILEKSEKLDKTGPEYFLKWIALCQKEPGLGDPIAVLRRAIRLHNESDELHNCLAYTVQQQDGQLAEKEWQKVLEINPDHLGGHAGLARLYAQSDRGQDLLPHVEILLKRAENVGLLKEVGGYCLHNKQFDLAIGLFSKVLNHQPDDIQVLSDISTCYAKSGQIEAALIGYREVLKLNPGDPIVHKNMKILEKMLVSQMNG